MRGRSLTVDTVIPYLIERNLVSVASIVEGDLEVIDAGRRNQNLKIVRRHGPSYLIKQPGEGERATDATLSREASFYNYCLLDPGVPNMRALLPAVRGWDENRCLLMLELIDGGPLWAHYARTPAPEFSSDAAAPLGDALGTVHRLFGEQPSWPVWMTGLPATPPWILFAHRPTPEFLAGLSPANSEVLKMLQKDRRMAGGLDSLRTEWAANTLIHNDIKGDNILVTARDNEGVRVRIIDWELIQIGDAAWDVGGVFRDFLEYWLLTVPLSGDLTPEQMLDGAQLPLAKLHPAARAFWHAYRTSTRMDSNSAGTFLLRSLRFAAARMAQAAYELSSSVREPSNLAVAMLQLAVNILADARHASIHLFGIPAPWIKTEHAAYDG
jgi:hypothetical protein